MTGFIDTCHIGNFRGWLKEKILYKSKAFGKLNIRKSEEQRS